MVIECAVICVVVGVVGENGNSVRDSTVSLCVIVLAAAWLSRTEPVSGEDLEFDLYL